MKTLTFAVFFLLAGCATTAEQANESTARIDADVSTLNSAPCCANASTIKYLEIRSGRNSIVPIDESSPIISLSNGRSYAVGFLAPPRTRTTSLTIRAFGVGIYAPTSVNFFPSFLFYNEDGAPIEITIPWTLRPVRADWVDRASLEALIELPPSTTPTRVLVYTRPDSVTKRSPVIVANGTYLVPNGLFGSVRAIWP